MSDDRWPVAKAYQRATQVVGIAIGMVLPGLCGYWIDRRFGTLPVVTILGFGMGLGYGIFELVRLSKYPEGENDDEERADNPDDSGNSDAGRERR